MQDNRHVGWYKLCSVPNHMKLLNNEISVPPRVRKLVRFPTHQESLAFVVASLSLDEYSSEERMSQWYSKADYLSFNDTSKMISSALRRFRHGELLLTAFSEDHNLSQQALNTWSYDGDSRRGIEIWANLKHGQQRRLKRKAAIQGLLFLQKEMRARDEASPDILCRFSELLTHDAREFARRM